jgi:hypothetical protein
MENTIDLRKTGAENIIGKFSKNILLNILYLYVRERFVHRGTNIYMTARQAETILMLSDFLEKRPSGDSKHCEDRESEANVMRENTVFELAMLVRTMAKGVAGVPSMISIKDMSIGYGHVCDEHNGRY